MADYDVVIEPLSVEDGGGFLARVPDLPGCMSDGETPEEAIVNVRDAIAVWVHHEGALAPVDGNALIDTIQIQVSKSVQADTLDWSTRFSYRLSEGQDAPDQT